MNLKWWVGKGGEKALQHPVCPKTECTGKKRVEIESSVGKQEEHMNGSQTCHPHYITRFDFHVSDIVRKQIVLATERTNECNLNMQKSFY